MLQPRGVHHHDIPHAGQRASCSIPWPLSCKEASFSQHHRVHPCTIHRFSPWSQIYEDKYREHSINANFMHRKCHSIKINLHASKSFFSRYHFKCTENMRLSCASWCHASFQLELLRRSITTDKSFKPAASSQGCYGYSIEHSTGQHANISITQQKRQTGYTTTILQLPTVIFFHALHSSLPTSIWMAYQSYHYTTATWTCTNPPQQERPCRSRLETSKTSSWPDVLLLTMTSSSSSEV